MDGYGKKAIREVILNQRNTIPLEERREKSKLILARLIQFSDFSKAHTVMIYVSFGSEVMTENLILHALSNKKKVVVPVVELSSHRLLLSKIKHYDELVPSTYGIKEPKQVRAVHPDEVELFILPGVGFDEQGTRLGYGGGYFDRLLHSKKKYQKLIGLAYEWQMRKELPCTQHDISVNMVITEEKLRSFNLRLLELKPEEGGEKD